MNINWEAILWYAVALDAIGVCVLTFLYLNWYEENLPSIHKLFPLSKGWALAYLIIVLWLGSVLLRMEILPW
ncbi:MAG: hypothetical protein CMI23_09970 [Opitutae bacterium]|nr:hypothetical protein [Opitutae bacterium]